MAYLLVIDPDVEARLDELPAAAIPAYNTVVGALVLNPWAGSPTFGDPTSPLRFFTFSSSVGGGFVYYFISEQPRLVRVYDLLWSEN